VTDIHGISQGSIPATSTNIKTPNVLGWGFFWFFVSFREEAD
jgi:hypothetical protein